MPVFSKESNKQITMLVPTTINLSKCTNLNILSTNLVKANYKICRLRNLNVKLRRKMTRLKNDSKLKKLCETINNFSNTKLIKIFV